MPCCGIEWKVEVFVRSAELQKRFGILSATSNWSCLKWRQLGKPKVSSGQDPWCLVGGDFPELKQRRSGCNWSRVSWFGGKGTNLSTHSLGTHHEGRSVSGPSRQQALRPLQKGTWYWKPTHSSFVSPVLARRHLGRRLMI